jgi:hypothetical protein
MKQDNNRHSVALVAGVMAIAVVCIPRSSRAAEATWSASSGSSPTAANPPWQYYSEPTGTATMTPDGLRLDTNPAFARATYFQTADQLSVPSNLVIEARVRFVSGSSDVVGHAPAGVSVYPGQGVANYLWIGKDEIFVNAGTRFERGDAAAVDTDDAFHDYRIELGGTTDGSPFRVFYDGALTLTGSLFPGDEDQLPEIGWGDIAYDASGVSEWQLFQHNGAAVPEPSAAAGCFLAGLVLLSRRPARSR